MAKRTKKRASTRKRVRGHDKVAEVMHEFKHRQLHSGSPDGKVVRNRRQAIAIALSVQRKTDEKRRKWRVAKARTRGKKKCKHCAK